MPLPEIGFIHGRFQVLHNDHLKYLLTGKERCRHLVVGITNPDPTLTREDPVIPGRSEETANPFTYYERFLMVRAALTEAGLGLEQFSVVPFPVNLPQLYRYYAPMDAVFFLTIYDGWGEKKLAMFLEMGLQTEILWRRSLEEKGLSGSEVRRRIVTGEAWQDLVPKSVAGLLLQWKAAERLRQDVRNCKSTAANLISST